MASHALATVVPTALRILVVDDYVASAQTLGWMIEALGHEVRLAHDGSNACIIARSFLPDVIFLDINLPGMNGYDVCRALRVEPGLEKTVFIAQTGWDQPEHLQLAKAAGFQHHLVKPVKLDVMENLLLTLNVTQPVC